LAVFLFSGAFFVTVNMLTHNLAVLCLDVVMIVIMVVFVAMGVTV
jgi:hypothetical protein